MGKKRSAAILEEPAPVPAGIRNRVISRERMDVSALLANSRNFRTHPETQRAALLGVLEEVGQVGELYAYHSERNGGKLTLCDGHLRQGIGGTWDVAILDLNDAEADKLLAVYDHISAEATLDPLKLDALLRDIETASPAIADMLARLAEAGGVVPRQTTGGGGDDFDTTVQSNGDTRCKTGDLWLIDAGNSNGGHRLLCGNSENADNIKRLFGGAHVDTCISDPPYGISFDTDYRRFTSGFDVPGTNHLPVANDDKPFDPAPYLEFENVVLWGGNCYSQRLPMGTWLVWDKRFKNGTAMLSDAELAWMKGGHGVYIFAETSQGFVRPEAIDHPTQKPISVMQWCIEKCKAGLIVFDPYLGSGTTLIASHRMSRRCFGMELEPSYCDVILRRAEAEGLAVVRDDSASSTADAIDAA